jgi:hypothetical protein
MADGWNLGVVRTVEMVAMRSAIDAPRIVDRYARSAIDAPGERTERARDFRAVVRLPDVP